jgi:hypothetical protein
VLRKIQVLQVSIPVKTLPIFYQLTNKHQQSCSLQIAMPAFVRVLLALASVAVFALPSRSAHLPAFSLFASSADSTRYHLRYGNELHKGTDPASHSDQPHFASQSFNSQAVHGAYVPEGLGSVIFPIYQASTFRFDSAEDGAKCFGGESDGFIYTRFDSHKSNVPAASVFTLFSDARGSPLPSYN